MGFKTIRVSLLVIIKNIKSKNLVTINDEVHNILRKVCDACDVRLREFSIDIKDRDVECKFVFDMLREKDTQVDEDELCVFIDNMCKKHDLKPIEFFWQEN